jgi:hypothetical protein
VSTFRCRVIKPRVSEWKDVESDCKENAVQDFFCPISDEYGHRFRHELPDNRREIIHFGLIEVEGHGELLTRTFSSGIWRQGGVKPHHERIEDVAKIIGWEHDPKELLEEWDNEESWEDASERKYSHDGGPR